MEIEAWAESVVQEIYETWKTRFSPWPSGIKVFYSPVRINADVMIVGHNPGGVASHFDDDKEKFEGGDFSLPPFNEYLSHPEYHISKKMRSFFYDPRLLKESVTLNLIFFRSKDVKEWDSILRGQRLAMEQYCHRKFIEIVEKLKPKVILAEGMKTYDDIVKILAPVQNTTFIKRKSGGRLLCSCVSNGTTIFGIPHPSGARVSSEEWNKLKETINPMLGTIVQKPF